MVFAQHICLCLVVARLFYQNCVQSLLLQPGEYVRYVFSWHGIVYGFLLFLVGFIIISVQEDFWPAAENARWAALLVAFGLYLTRLLVFDLDEAAVPFSLLGLESVSWMLAIRGFASRYLNKPSPQLRYLSTAVYPVYIVHYPVQCGFALIIFALPIPAGFKFLLLITAVFAVSLLLFELIRRVKYIRPLFGIKFHHGRQSRPEQVLEPTKV